jgi:spore maturation protein CgeB
MGYRFLILNTDYPDFLRWLYAQHPGLEKRPYEEQMRARNKSLFSTADFYSSNLRKLGHEADDIVANNVFLQGAWATEHGITTQRTRPLQKQWRGTLQQMSRIADRTHLKHVKPLLRHVFSRVDDKQNWFHNVLAAQINHYKPDILFNLDLVSISTSFLREMKPHVRLLVGQIASPLPQGEDLNCFDLIVSSLPNFVQHFQSMGILSRFQRLAFEPKVLSKLGPRRGEISISFVGQVSPHHQARINLLNYLCEKFEVKIWGMGFDQFPTDSPIRRCYVGTAWGVPMYEILNSSKITLNQHIDIAGPYANNMRLYEATGVGTMLITDSKDNLRDMFEPGTEVLAYRTPEECAQMIQYYLDHNKEREVIAKAGQERTLREHTYCHRTQELLEIIQKCL